jgi:pimeloyl-ACP methyl ester carboxylesterase
VHTRPLLAVVIAVVLAGCGDTGTDRRASANRTPATGADATGTQESTGDRPPDLRTACGTTEGLSSKAFWLRTSDGVRLYGVEAGGGTTTVVLAHEGRDSLCGGWLPYAARLVRLGFRVVMFDFRGNGGSDTVAGRTALRLDRDLVAAVRRARGAGARVPFLYIGTTNDSAAPAKEARTIFERVGSRDKRIVMFGGVLHGTELVDTAPFAPQVRALVLRWLRRHSRA